MDADEALARHLQAEEDAETARWHQQQQPAERDFTAALQRGVRTILQYEQPGMQDKARSAMPLAQLRAGAADAAALSAAMREAPPAAEQDELAQQLLTWFKTRFFTWVDKPGCHMCGSRETLATGVEAPTPQEAAGGAGRTEVYRCTACMASARFPRYNDPAKLLETRRGRCGEWANCFCLCLRAAGLAARWVMDWADHVWCEYYSEALGRWVHVDPCEAAWDRPLLYEAGWGKQQSYVVAFGVGGVADVTRRYTADYAATQTRRTKVSEQWLANAIGGVTGQLRASLPTEERREAEARDAAEAAQLRAGAGGGAAAAAQQDLPGRQTGSLEWRAARGELGASPPAPAAAKQTPGTRWRRAAAAPAAGSAPHRICCAAVRASGQNEPSETAVHAFDGDPQTKWLDVGGGSPGQATWLEAALLPTSSPPDCATLTSYSLVSANDAPERDPADFVLEGCCAGSERPPEDGTPARAAGCWQRGGDWRVLDTREGVRFAGRGQRLTFQVASAPACRHFRLTISRVRDVAAASAVHLACLDLHHVPSASIAPARAPLGAAAAPMANALLPAPMAKASLPAPSSEAAPAEQLSRLMVSQPQPGTGASAPAPPGTAGADAAPAAGSPQPAGIAAAAPAAVAAPASVVASPAASAAVQDDKAAFAARVGAHFDRLMVGGEVAPAAAAAEALKLAAQEQGSA